MLFLLLSAFLDTRFYLAESYLVGATMYDIKTSHLTLKYGMEGNPAVRPYIANHVNAYVIQGTVDVALIGYAVWAKKSTGKFHKTWWIPALVVGTMHFTAGTFNLRLVIRR